MNPGKNSIHYSFEDWNADWLYLGKLESKASPQGLNQIETARAYEYFETKYGERAEAHGALLIEARRYVSLNKSDLDVGSLAISSKDGLLVSEALRLVLWGIYVELPDSPKPWPPHEIVKLARKTNLL